MNEPSSFSETAAGLSEKSFRPAVREESAHSARVVFLSPKAERFAGLAQALEKDGLRVSAAHTVPGPGKGPLFPDANAVIAWFPGTGHPAVAQAARLAQAIAPPLIVALDAPPPDYGLAFLRQGVQEIVFLPTSSTPAQQAREIHLATLRAVERHRAQRDAEQARTAERRQTELRTVIDLFPVALIMAGWDARIRIMNERARALLAEHDALFVDAEGRLKLAHKDSNSQFIATMRQIETGADTDCALSAPCPSGLAPLSILVTPVGHGEQNHAKGVALFIAAPESPLDIAPATLEGLYGLTLAEARLVIALVSGQKLDDVAQASGTSLHTLRNHLKAVFRKTGANRQAELVKLVLTGPAVFRKTAPAF